MLIVQNMIIKKKSLKKDPLKKKKVLKNKPLTENLFRIKELMIEKNIGRTELAAYCQISEASVSSISTGKNTPSFKVLLLMAKKFDVDVRDLFYATKPTSATEAELREAKELIRNAMKLLDGINK